MWGQEQACAEPWYFRISLTISAQMYKCFHNLYQTILYGNILTRYLLEKFLKFDLIKLVK